MFIGEHWMVTCHRGAGDLIGQVVRRAGTRRADFAGCYIGVAVYSLLDVIVDGYFDTIDRFEAFYDEAADQVFGEQPIEPSEHRHWFEMRRALNQFDRIVRPADGGADDGRRPGPRALRPGLGAVPARRRG